MTLELEATGGKVTRTGQLLGTPRYVAPEQVSATGLGPHTDAFGLGATLHHALCARWPHQVDDDPSVMALIARRVREPAANVRRWRPEVPVAVATLVAELLATDP